MSPLGIDIVDLRRIKNKEEFFAKGILSDKEYEEFLKRPNKIDYLGGRYAAKEAFIKVNKLSAGLTILKEIEVLNNPDGSPYILYKGQIFDVSISHDGDYAVAVVAK